MYITNTVGKRSIGIASTASNAPDGSPFVNITNDSFYSANHGLYTNQTVFFSAECALWPGLCITPSLTI